MNQKVLIADSSVSQSAPWRDYLIAHGYEVCLAVNELEIIKQLNHSTVDLLLINPSCSWRRPHQLVKALRIFSMAPMIMACDALDSHTVEDRINSLEAGADDWVGRAINTRELLARIRIRLRQQQAGAAIRRCRFAGRLWDGEKRLLVLPDGKHHKLTKAEQQLLTAFLHHRQQILSREQILAITRPTSVDVYDRSIDMQILRLRRKVETEPQSPRLILTERGLGYVFTAEVEEVRH